MIRTAPVKKIVVLDKIYLHTQWSIGGITGGSCWDDGAEDQHHSYTSDETEPDLDDLDTILLAICPDISYLQYKQVTKDIIETKSWSQNEYYGNCTNYMSKSISLKALFGKLVKMKIFNANTRREQWKP